MARVFRWFFILLLLLVIVAGAAVAWAHGQLRASLPQLDGSRTLAGLVAPVAVARDALGIPTIEGATREDVARATGFLHAQDRFFQMDLARRRAAGELAALVGPRALSLDRDIRVHRFRAEAREALSRLVPEQRRLLEAYSDGVNSGLTALAAAPFEYLVLRQTPATWRPEDSLLVVLSMFITLQDPEAGYESTLATMADVLPPPMAEFLSPQGSEWDAPLLGGPYPMPPIPGPDVYNPRETRRGRQPPPLRGPNAQDPMRVSDNAPDVDAAVGSNNFAVAAALTGDGAALLANDMHLSIRVPNTWYRAVFVWPGHRLMGLTLPGMPAMVVGSNTHIAWGFTNTYADWSDIVLLETDSARPGQYRTAEGWRSFDEYEEQVEVAGDAPVRVLVRWTIWGPVMRPDHRGVARALRWVAHSAERLATSIVPLEDARSVDAAVAEVNGLGTPGQNFVVVDRAGRIAWSIYGSIPRRVGLDGRLPQSWADGARRWEGWLAPGEYPRLIDPPGGRVWTANARVVDGEALARLGDGSYEIGSRARLIRDRLLARTRFTPRDLLDIQLDTHAAFLERWRTALLNTLTPEANAGHPARTELRDLLERGWSGHAAADSAAYRLTRVFRDVVSERLTAFLLADCYEADPTFDYRHVRRRDAAISRLIAEQPLHLLDAQYTSWSTFLLEAVDDTIAATMRDASGSLRDRTWSEYNVTAYRHPLSPSLPFVGRWLDMPHHELPGDLFTPRVHFGALGASQRMIVSPGREADGIMHMPTGQSGHPLSPFYANSHEAWVKGEATPFLPGPAAHRLTLTATPLSTRTD